MNVMRCRTDGSRRSARSGGSSPYPGRPPGGPYRRTPAVRDAARGAAGPGAVGLGERQRGPLVRSEAPGKTDDQGAGVEDLVGPAASLTETPRIPQRLAQRLAEEAPSASRPRSWARQVRRPGRRPSRPTRPLRLRPAPGTRIGKEVVHLRRDPGPAVHPVGDRADRCSPPPGTSGHRAWNISRLVRPCRLETPRWTWPARRRPMTAMLNGSVGILARKMPERT